MTARKTRADSVLGSLPEDDQEELYLSISGMTLVEGQEWLAEHKGISLSITALSRWIKIRRDQAQINRLRRGRDRLAEAEQALGVNQAERYDPVIMEACREYTLDLLASEQVDAKAVSGLLKAITAAQKLKLDSGRLDIDKRKLELLEAKAAMADEGKEALENESLTPEEKEQQLKSIFGIGR